MANWFRKRQKVYEARQRSIDETCKEHKVTLDDSGYFREEIKLKNYVLSRNENILGCLINKVASSSFLRTFISLSDMKVKEVASPFAHIGKFIPRNATELVKAQQDYFKFMFVRHPMERLVSCYVNKVEAERKGEDGFSKLVKTKADEIRKSRGEKVLDKTDTVTTFDDFIEYALNDLSGEEFASHWVPYWKACSPCHFKFDMIGKLESSFDDFTVSRHLKKIHVHKKIFLLYLPSFCGNEPI